MEERISQGLSITAVSEATLELDQSDAEGRVVRVDFGPEVLGLDLAFDHNISAVSEDQSKARKSFMKQQLRRLMING